MPALNIFRRKLPLGSDDFSFCWNFPTYFYHPIWLILLLSAWYPFTSSKTETPFQDHSLRYRDLNEDRKLCITQARTWLIASFVFFSLSLFMSITTNIASNTGTIFMEPVSKNIRDCWVRLLVIFQAFLGLLEFLWGVTGVVVYSVSVSETNGPGIACLNLVPTGSDFLLAACIFVLSRRVISLCFFCGCLISGQQENNTPRNPGLEESLLDGENKEDGSATIPSVRNLEREESWTKCCRMLCCCLVSEEQAFEDVGRLLSDWFSDFDVVPTDMAAMLYAVHVDQHRQKEREKIHNNSSNNTTALYPHENTDRPRFGGSTTTDIVLLQNIVDNVRFAYAAYGWPLHTYDGLASCAGCRLLCCGAMFCHCCTSDIHTSVKKTNTCCQGLKRCHGFNTASMVALAKIRPQDVIYVSWKNNMKEYSPYALMVDHNTKQVVIAVRGTLSMSDCMTDVLATEMLLTDIGNEWQFDGNDEYGHAGIFGKGIVMTRHILKMGYLHRLLHLNDEEINVIPPPKASSDWITNLPNCTNYELLITGHSLGAGIATVVSLLLKAKFPALKCIAYSPPGGMLTKSLAIRTREFVTSVVIGDDMISRLGVHSMFRLREQMFDVVPRMMNVSKSTMLWKIAMGSDVPELLMQEEVEENKQTEQQEQQEQQKQQEQKHVSATGTAKQYSSSALRSAAAPLKEHTRVPSSIRRMYPPGWLLHLRLVSETRACLDTCCCSGCCCISALLGVGDRVLKPVWLNQDGLQEVIVSRTMASDHFPDRVVAALREIRPTNEDVIIAGEGNDPV